MLAGRMFSAIMLSSLNQILFSCRFLWMCFSISSKKPKPALWTLVALLKSLAIQTILLMSSLSMPLLIILSTMWLQRIGVPRSTSAQPARIFSKYSFSMPIGLSIIVSSNSLKNSLLPLPLTPKAQITEASCSLFSWFLLLNSSLSRGFQIKWSLKQSF